MLALLFLTCLGVAQTDVWYIVAKLLDDAPLRWVKCVADGDCGEEIGDDTSYC